MNLTFPPEKQISLSASNFSYGPSSTYSGDNTNFNFAREIENFDFSSGELRNGIGFKNLTSCLNEEQGNSTLANDLDGIGDVVRVFHFYKYNQITNCRDDKLIFVNHLYQVFYINLYSQNKTLYSLRNITFTSLPVAVRYRLNGEDVILFSSETDNMVVWNGTDQPYEVLDSPKISSMVIHYERLFATVDKEKSAVWFSDDLDPTSWTVSLDEAGFIELIDERGALEKVISFSDYLYIFREYGISRLTAFASQTSFSANNLFVSSGKIYSSSACVCGDKILFLANDGIYKFDGLNTTKILTNISNNLLGIDNSNAMACYHNGKYYLACNYKFASAVESALLVINIDTLKLESILRGVKVNYLTSLNTDILSGVIALTNYQNDQTDITMICDDGAYLSVPLKKVYCSQTTFLSYPDKKKTLKKILLNTKGDIDLFISNGLTEEKIFVKGSPLPQILRVNIPLYEFAYKIESNNQICNIKNIKFIFSC